MKRVRIDPMEYPLEKGESWWIVHPNIKAAEFRVPSGAITACLKEFLIFKQNVVYSVISADNHNGWVTVGAENTLYDMPQYLFARHFDAETFVVGKMTPEEAERAQPFDYQPTIPMSKIPKDIYFKG